MHLTLLLCLFMVTPARAGDCPADLAAVSAAIDAAEAAYTDLREDSFRWSRHEALRLLGCLEDPLPGELAARLHLVELLDARLAGDSDRMNAALEAMVAAEPTYQPDSRVAPTGSSLEKAIDVARGESWSSQTRQLPDGLSWVVDGTSEATQFPLDRASVVQRLGEDARGWYLTAGEVPDALLPQPGARLRRPLTIAAIGAGIGAAAAWSAATAMAPPPGDLKGDESLGASRAAGWAGVGLSAGALGLGGAAVYFARVEF